MKKSILLLVFSFLLLRVYAQCVLEPFSLQKRVYMSDLVLEAMVIDQYSSWDLERKFIYTVHLLKPYRVFKGEVQDSKPLYVVTEGGRVDLDMLRVSPGLELQTGEFGLFTLNRCPKKAAQLTLSDAQVFEASASLQSFIQYDPVNLTAHSYYKNYDGIPLLHKELESYIQEEPKLLAKPHWESGIIRPLAAPIITSWSADTASAGTEMLLTLNGSNFGIARGSGRVEFLDANYGDGRFYNPSWASSYKSWSNSKIEVLIPTRAGTGNIRVTNNGGESTTTSTELFVKYSHLNVSYGTSGIDTAYFPIDHVNTNQNGGYTWRMNRKFRLRENAVNSFLRSLETWRCGSLMNWDVGDITNVDEISRDQVNLVRFTKFSDSRLGVCYSWYNGCFQGSVMHWYASELDIEFDSSRNWYYGTGKPGTSQYDFQSVATHELGHGHQLGHVNDENKIMHYSLRNGDRRVSLDEFDVEGAEYVREKSRVNNPCGPNRLVPISLSACNITKPKASFTLSTSSVCPGIDLTATDKSEGIVKSYAWSFGSDASLSTSSAQGPHVFSYSGSGSKTVRLIVSNDFGSDTSNTQVTVQNPKPGKPQPFAYEDSVCQGRHRYRIDSVEFATEYLWAVPNGGNIEGSFKLDSITVDWVLAGGPHILSVQAVNSCGSGDTVARLIQVKTKARADFDISLTGRDAIFVFTGEGADSLNWNFGDGSSSVETDPTHTFPSADNYDVTLIASNFCSADTFTQTITTSFGAGLDQISSNSLLITPNPVQDIFRIYSEEMLQQATTVRIYSYHGALLKEVQTEAGNLATVSASGWVPGVYHVELQTPRFKTHALLIKGQ